MDAQTDMNLSSTHMSNLYIMLDTGSILYSLGLSSYTPDRGQLKTMKVDQNSIETEFSVVICRPTGDKWQSKTMFL